MQKPNLLEDKPIVNADENVWGIKLNKIIDKLQAFVNNIVDSLNTKLDMGNVSNAFSTAERIEQKVKEKLDKSVYDNFKEEIDKHTLDYKTFKKEFIDGNYLKFNTTKNLEDKDGVVKDVVIENITINTINGEPYTKGSNISEEDVKKIGDKHYEPKIEKKSGFNLDISSDVTSNAENIIASTKLVNQVNIDLQNKIKNINIEDKVKNKVDKTQITNIIKDLKLENEKLKYKQYDGTQDVDKEIELPNGATGGTSELDTFYKKQWKENTNAKGNFILECQYTDFYSGQFEDRFDGEYFKLFASGKIQDTNYLRVDVKSLSLDSLNIGSITHIAEYGYNSKPYRVDLNYAGQRLLGNLPKSTDENNLFKGNTVYFNRLHGYLTTDFGRTTHINVNKYQYKSAESNEIPIQEVSEFIQINTNYTQIYTEPRTSELGQKLITTLQSKLKLNEVLENEKVYITVGHFYISNDATTKIIYGKNQQDLKILPISEETEVKPISTDFLPKSFPCLVYLTDTDINYLPLINHFKLVEYENTTFYNYFKNIYTKLKSWDSDYFFHIVNIIPKQKIDIDYKGIILEDNVLRCSTNYFLNEKQYSEDMLNLETNLTKEKIEKYYNNVHWGYLVFNHDENFVHIIMELDYRPYINQLYISKNAYENIGNKTKQLEYRNDLISKFNQSQEGIPNNSNNWADKIIHSSTDSKLNFFDRTTGNVVNETEVLDNPKIYPILSGDNIYNIGVFKYLILQEYNPYRKNIRQPDLNTFKSKFITDALGENVLNFQLEVNKVYIFRSKFVIANESLNQKYKFGTNIEIDITPNNISAKRLLKYSQANPTEVITLGIYLGSSFHLYPLCESSLILPTQSYLYSFFNNLLQGKNFVHIVGYIPYINKHNKTISEGISLDSLGHNELIVSTDLYLNIEDYSKIKQEGQSELYYNKLKNFCRHLGYLVKVPKGIYFIGEKVQFDYPVMTVDDANMNSTYDKEQLFNELVKQIR